MKSHITVLSLLGYICFVDNVRGQQFTDGTLGQSYPDVSNECGVALNTTVQSCPVALATFAVDMPRLEASLLGALCTLDCRSSLQSAREAIASRCTSKDTIEIASIVFPATFVIDKLIYTYDLSCAKDR